MRGHICSILLASFAAAQESASQGGLSVGFRIDSGTGTLDTKSAALVEVTIKDSRTNQPVSGLRPSLWFDRRRANGTAEESSCADKAKSFASGKVGLKADVDLNTFVLVTMNDDASVTFINPMVRFEPTRLESIVALPGRPLDWAQTPNGRTIAITIPQERKIALIDTLTRKLSQTIAIEGSGNPSRIVISPLGRFAFAGLDNSNRVAVIDLAEQRVIRYLEAASGLHGLAVSDDGRHLAVTSTDANRIDLYSIANFTHLRTIETGRTPVAVTWSRAASAFYTAGLNDRFVTIIDPEDATSKPQRIDAGRGIAHLSVEPGGRFVVAISQTDSKVHLIDSASNQITATSDLDTPDQTVFSGVFATIRSVNANKWTMFDLTEIRKGHLQPAQISIGEHAPAANPAAIGVAAMAAPLPGARMLAMASAADQMMYTMASTKYLGTHRNYGRTPLGLLVLDHGLQETAPGVYSAAVNFPFGGRFDAPLSISQPAAQFCFTAEVKGPKRAEAARSLASAKVQPLAANGAFRKGEAVPLRFQFLDRDSAKPVTGLRDARLVLVKLPSLRKQSWMVEVQPGVYESTESFAEEGEYEVVAAADSLKLGFHECPPMKVKIGQ